MPTSTDNAGNKKQELPSHFLFQWHITERCNLHCAHCYQESAPPAELSFDKLLEVLQQLEDFIATARNMKAAPILAHITVTGGEPFIRPDFPKLLDLIAAKRNLWSFAVLSNGTLIDSKTAAHLASLKPDFAQVSIEGSEETHDSICGPGSYRLAVRSLEHLVSHNVPAYISFTANRDNLHQFPAVAQLARSLGVQRLWADRMIPLGNSDQALGRILSPEETMSFFETMAAERKKFSFARTEIAMHRALQFIAGQGTPYRCSAGHSLITILPDGTLVPCRRMPTPSGNIFEQPLKQLYFSSLVFKSLQDRNRIPRGCEKCFYSDLCNGGLKCLSASVQCDPFTADPGCWLKTPHSASTPKAQSCTPVSCGNC